MGKDIDKEIDLLSNPELRKEMTSYKFPEYGTEFISSQINRYYKMFKSDNKKDLLASNESLITISNYDAIECENKFLYMFNSSYILNSMKPLLENTNEVTTVIFHHKDLDGNLSAGIISRIFLRYSKDINFNNELMFTPYNYVPHYLHSSCNQMNKQSMQNRYKICIITDISLTDTELKMLIDTFDNIIWIDHHSNSIDVAKSVAIPKGKKVQYVLDTRYSASYLAYILFKDQIKTMCKLKVKDTMPTIVSMFDTKTIYRQDLSYVPIKINPELKKKLLKKGVNTYKINMFTDSIERLNRLSDTSILNGKTIYIPNINKDHDEFKNGYECGSCLNSYYLSMNNMEPFRDIYNKVLTDDNVLSKMINIGQKIKEINLYRSKIIGENEIYYCATHKGKNIVGIGCEDISRFAAKLNFIKATKVLIHYKSYNKVVVSIKTEDMYLRKINLGKYISNIFGVGGGHNGVATFTSSVNLFINLIKAIEQRSLPKKSNISSTLFTSICKTYDKIYFTTQGNSSRYEERIMNIFKFVSAVVFSVWDESIQNTIEEISK